MKRVTGVVLSDTEARQLARAIITAHEFIRARHGAGIAAPTLVLAAQLTTATGQPEPTPTSTEHAVEYERIDTKEAARILDCSQRNIRALAAAGRLPGHRHGGRWSFHRDDVLVHRDYRDDRAH